jgi:integrase/recombinase XerD
MTAARPARAAGRPAIALTPTPRPLAVATDGGGDLLGYLARSWKRELEVDKAEGTVRLYVGGVDRFAGWHAQAYPGQPVTAGSLNRQAVAAFLADLRAAGAAAATRRARFAALQQFAHWLVDPNGGGQPGPDPLLGMNPPPLDEPDVDGLTDAELAALIRACKPPAGADRWTTFECLRDEAVVRLLTDTGARAGEMVALTTGDVDLDRKIVTIRRGKGGKSRISPFTPLTARAIDRYLRQVRRIHSQARTSDRLWWGTANRGWSYSALRGSLAKRAEAAGITGFHPHRLRHTSAAALLDAGVAEGDVMASHGWRSRQMLDRYVKHNAQERAAANIAAHFAERDRKDR